MTVSTKLKLDGRTYQLEIERKVICPPEAPRLVIPSLLPNEAAMEILRVCLASLQKYTQEPHEIWVVDNNSPEPLAQLLLQIPEINIVLNRTEPLPQEGRASRFSFRREKSSQDNWTWGSYANAVALEIGSRLIDPATQYLMTLHMDTAATHDGWLQFLKSKLKGKVAASGVRMDKVRTPEGVLHILGCLLDFQIFRQLNLNFYPRLPQYDVGDLVTVNLRKAGYEVFACHNTNWEPELIAQIQDDSPFKSRHMDRVFDDEGNIIFLHMGRGVRKSQGHEFPGLTPEGWVEFARQYILA